MWIIHSEREDIGETVYIHLNSGAKWLFSGQQAQTWEEALPNFHVLPVFTICEINALINILNSNLSVIVFPVPPLHCLVRRTESLFAILQ